MHPSAVRTGPAGHLSDDIIRSISGVNPDTTVLARFVQDGNGLLYNVRLEEENRSAARTQKDRRVNARARKSCLPTQDGIDREPSSTHTAYAEHMPGRSAEHMEKIEIEI